MIKTAFVCCVTMLWLAAAACSSREKDKPLEIEYQRVSAAAGLNLRERPERGGTIMLTIPAEAIVAVGKKAGKEVVIDGRRGHWVSVTWKGRRGWAFDAYLTDKTIGTDEELRTGCRAFRLYSTLCFDRADLTPAGTAALGSVKPGEFREIPLEPGMLAKPLAVAPGDDMILISPEGVVEDRVTALVFAVSPVYTHARFVLASNSHRSGFEAGVFIRAADLRHMGPGLPQIVAVDTPEETGNTGALIASLARYCYDRDISLVFDSVGEASPKKEEHSYEWYVKTLGRFKTERRAFTDRASGKQVDALLLAGSDGDDSRLALFFGNRVVYFSHASMAVAFTLNNETYVCLNHWLPRSGCIGKRLYMVKDGRLVLVTSDYSYAN